MTTLLQISDPHFGTERPEVVAALLRFAHDLAPDVALLSGDITQRARRGQFERARAFSDALAVPRLLAIPGNHDVPLFNFLARVVTPYANFDRAFGPDREPAFDGADLLLVTVDTTRWYRHKDGEIAAAQIDRVSRRLGGAKAAQVRIVVAHHPVFAIQASDEANVLHGHAAAIRTWSSAGADLIVGGHIHLPYVRALREHYPELPRELYVVQAGTAVSSRVRHEAGNSVNVFRIPGGHAARRCVVERWDYVPDQRSFAQASRHDLRLDTSQIAVNL